MSVTVRKSDGDLYIDRETGRGEEVSGPTKVSQEMFSLYASEYDEARQWGSELALKNFNTVSSMMQMRTLMYFRLQQANQRLISKQSADVHLDDTERIREFSQAKVIIDPVFQAVLFQVVADVGDPATQVGKNLYMTYKPVSIKHVVPVPIDVVP